jgi:hypothetical protein
MDQDPSVESVYRGMASLSPEVPLTDTDKKCVALLSLANNFFATIMRNKIPYPRFSPSQPGNTSIVRGLTEYLKHNLTVAIVGASNTLAIWEVATELNSES